MSRQDKLEFETISRENSSADSRHRRNRKHRRKAIIRRRILFGGVIVLVVAGIIGTIVIVKNVSGSSKEEVAEEIVEKDTTAATDLKTDDSIDAEETEESEDTDDAGDPESSATSETGEEVNVADIVSASSVGENTQITYGIDVSKFQGTIDWSQVAGAGVNFAMIRVGYRDSSTGEIKADTNAKYNMQEAEKNGIKVGAYFFSTAISKEEAVAEADWVASYVAQYPITYPVGYNCEGFENSTSRQFSLTKDERSNIAMAFLDEIYNKGYTPMFYASKNEMADDAKWNTSTIETKYKMWMAWYNQDTSTLANGPAYDGQCHMWQYTNQGTVPGIPKKVDMDVAYFGYDGTETAKDTSERATASADVEALMKFTDVNETVTAKSKTNLRDKPSQGSDSTVKMTLTNGQTATRTGTSTSGWSRVVYDGVTYYAVSSYLTTDLTAAAQTTEQAAPAEEATAATSGFKTKFTDVNETVTAKDLVNLRSKPSVTDTDSYVVATLSAGQTAVRTGINNEYGWSRVEYNGQVLYCVSSYIKTVE
ncbi:MAG: glycoside hydrolase family 25 protein [Pseudobutyrivibrio sp.]|nr:glycoside hydrolase family 25 protein [Pseudobutyrivibrio sp.]